MSILVHVVLLLIVAFNPGWFEKTPHRVIRIAGEDFDLSRLELTPLVAPPRLPATPRTPPPAPVPVPVPVPAPTAPLVQPQQAAPPPPPPPPQPTPTPPPPDRIIRPDDQLIEGARPDGTPRASRGDTRDQAQTGGGPRAQEAQDAQEAQQALRGQRGQQSAANRSESLERILPRNTNPNALRAPTPGDVNRVIEAQLDISRRNGTMGRTGTARGDNNGTYSAENLYQILSPNPKGIDFGPYLNTLLDRLRRNWYAVMPEIARLGQKGRVDIVFSVSKSGMVKDLLVVEHSGVEALDKGALSAIHLSNPFQALPAEYETDLKLRIAFLYNMYP
jgi:TonB family protein